MSNINNGHDTTSLFHIEDQDCLILTVTIICGRNISRGLWNLVRNSSTYVLIEIPSSPLKKKWTTSKSGRSPLWKESLTFCIKEDKDQIMRVYLMEPRFGPDKEIAHVHYDVETKLEPDVMKRKTFRFGKYGEVDVVLIKEYKKSSLLRFSPQLCNNESEFITKRKMQVLEYMQDLLRDKAPKCLEEVPTIAIMGSGGGFRALTAFSGALKGLLDCGVFDCASYISGLSGSAWLLSTLYSHSQFMKIPFADIQNEIKHRINSSPIKLLTPLTSYRFVRKVYAKKMRGQHVSFTDVFGLMVGETLLHNIECRLSNQRKLLYHGQLPMPIYAGINVKRNVKAILFHEWVEFTPYEIGISKYEVFLPTELFGCEFYKGQLIKSFEEPPLHYLQGLWGSAFCALAKQLMKQLPDKKPDDEIYGVAGMMEYEYYNYFERDIETDSDESDCSQNFDDKHNDKNANKLCKQSHLDSYWKRFYTWLFYGENFLNDLSGRAAVIFNFMRGLIPKCNRHVETPCARTRMTFQGHIDDPEEFEGMHDLGPLYEKNMYMIDAGLAFNSPYPCLLRDSRDVDIILSFDFTGRESDDSKPFKTLEMAQKWAKKNKIRFPSIERINDCDENIKELYIFDEEGGPTILHFVLINKQFRSYKSPGVKRCTDEEDAFADFSIFGTGSPYSIYTFNYDHLDFERLATLMEFNVKNEIKEITDCIARCVQKKRNLQRMKFGQQMNMKTN